MSSSSDSVLRFEGPKRWEAVNMQVIDEDDRLSFKAKGIYVYLVGKGEGWEFNRSAIEELGPDGRTSISSGLRELKEAGYLKIERAQNEAGQFSGWTWTVSQLPILAWCREALEGKEKDPKARFPKFGKPEGGKPGGHINNKGISYKGSSDLRSSREEFLSSVEESPTTATLTEGIYAFAWLGENLPDQAPYQNGRRPEAIELSKLAQWQGLDRWKSADPEHYREAALRLVGLRALVEEGEVGHVEPGEPFCLGMAEPSREHAGQHLPTAALERGQRLQGPEEPDGKVQELFDEVGSHA